MYYTFTNVFISKNYYLIIYRETLYLTVLPYCWKSLGSVRFLFSNTQPYIWSCVLNNTKYFKQIQRMNEVETDFICYSNRIYTHHHHCIPYGLFMITYINMNIFILRQWLQAAGGSHEPTWYFTPTLLVLYSEEVGNNMSGAVLYTSERLHQSLIGVSACFIISVNKTEMSLWLYF